ncbi:MAG: polysaccharide deacetylase family protein [Rhodospirillales bacterium]|nr:polysaccharide deacetylase family protein [Rhodospirillales bacterium]
MRLRKLGRLVLMAAAFLSAEAFVSPPPAYAAGGAVVVMYHRFGEAKYPSTNVTLEQLDAHIQELTSGKYQVMDLAEIVKAMRDGFPLPDRAVGLSIDDAFLSVYTEAWPRLKKAGLPFTVFVATDPVDNNTSNFMSWEQIREMADAGVGIAGHTGSHLHMPTAGKDRIGKELARSKKRFQEKLGRVPEIFAYPYGESSLAVQSMVKNDGYIAAFGQHSGAFGATDPRFDLPRFAMNENYAHLSRFRLAVNAVPLPVTDITPTDPLITDHNPPAIGFTIAPGLKGLDRLACFSSHDGKARVERLGKSRIEVRVGQAFPKGRTRVNCTFPADKGRWHWFGRQFFNPG